MARALALVGLAVSVGCSNSATELPTRSDAGVAADASGRTDARTGDAAGEAEAGATPAVVFVDTATGAPVTRVLFGDPLDVQVTGAPAGARVTLEACLNGLGVWSSTSSFRASPTGVVDVAAMAPESAGYTGVDAGGIFWSMTPRKTPCNPSVPTDGISVVASAGGVVLAEATLEILLALPDVACANVGASGLVGYYCASKTAPRAGGIVTFGGSEGGLGTGQYLAGYYASLGYPTLGLAYFGAGSLPPTLASIPLEYFQTAFQWLVKQKEVLPGKLLVNGASRGGELSLLLGATFPEVTAVVAELPSGVLWGSVDGTGPAWTYGGTPLPYITAWGNGQPYPVKEPGGVTAYADLPYFTTSLAASSAADIVAATPSVEKTRGPVLMIAGFDDQLWGACDLASYAVNRLVASGHADLWGDSLLCYPQAGHNVDSFGLNLPTTRSMYALDVGQTLALGGSAAGIAHASRDADTKKRAFFAANLR